MASSTLTKNNQGYNEVVPVICNATVSILALGQNARGLHKLLKDAPQAKFETYPGQTTDLLEVRNSCSLSRSR